jgi:hypothetical protein
VKSGSSIDWSRHFDRAYCFHYANDAARLPGLTEEFRRVGLLDSGIFRWMRTFPNPWEKRLIEARPDLWRGGPNKTSVSFLNLGFASMRAMREALADGCKRVLFLEADIRFLKDLSAIKDALDAIPDGFDVVQFDKFDLWSVTPDEYAAKVERQSVNAHYFDARGKNYMSGGCFMATTRGMENILRAMEEWRPGPMDGYLNMNGNTHAVAKRNLAVQVVMGDAMVFDYMAKRNTHHAAYRPQGLRYEDYAVPDGYGYDAVTAGG